MSDVLDKERLEQRLIDQWDVADGALLFDGQAGKAETLPRLRAVVVPASERQITIGHPINERAGVMIVQIFTKRDEGAREAFDLAEKVKLIFRRWRSLDGDLRVTGFDSVRVGEDGAAYQINVRISYRSQS